MEQRESEYDEAARQLPGLSSLTQGLARTEISGEARRPLIAWLNNFGYHDELLYFRGAVPGVSQECTLLIDEHRTHVSSPSSVRETIHATLGTDAHWVLIALEPTFAEWLLVWRINAENLAELSRLAQALGGWVTDCDRADAHGHLDLLHALFEEYWHVLAKLGHLQNSLMSEKSVLATVIERIEPLCNRSGGRDGPWTQAVGPLRGRKAFLDALVIRAQTLNWTVTAWHQALGQMLNGAGLPVTCEVPDSYLLFPDDRIR